VNAAILLAHHQGELAVLRRDESKGEPVLLRTEGNGGAVAVAPPFEV
jgi:hypothetical protein